MNQTSSWLMWVVAAVVLVVVVASGTYFGLRYFLGTPSVQTYQQCVAAGGIILESYPAQCTVQTADGPLTFTQPIEDEVVIPDSEEEMQPVIREPSLESQAAAQGKKIHYHDEVGFKVITSANWQEHLEFAYSGSQTRTPGFYPAMQLSPDDTGAETRVITFSLPLDPRKAAQGHAGFVANGLESIPNAVQLRQLEASFQSVEYQPTTIAGLPALTITRQVINDITNPPSGFCAGCWQKRVYIELPDGKIMEVAANWSADQTSFAQQFDQVIQSFQLLEKTTSLGSDNPPF